tara:strand:- start:329 stop:457 length:129 start_codon:yes stop_codon:yes gene_type:complete
VLQKVQQQLNEKVLNLKKEFSSSGTNISPLRSKAKQKEKMFF